MLASTVGAKGAVNTLEHVDVQAQPSKNCPSVKTAQTDLPWGRQRVVRGTESEELNPALGEVGVQRRLQKDVMSALGFGVKVGDCQVEEECRGG